MNRWHILFFFLLIFGSGWIWASRVPMDAHVIERMPEPAVGHPAPDFTLTTLNGETFSLAARRGTPIVLNFWATWCGPCRKELPALNRAAKRYAGEVLIVGVDQAEPPARVQQYVDELGLSFIIPMDTDQSIAHRYNVLGMPTTYFIDAEGTIRKAWTGEMNSITLAENIAEILSVGP